MTTKQLREMLRQAEVLEQNPQNKRKESATLMTQTEPLARTFWMSSKHELAAKVFSKAKKVYKQNLK
jgi:hypothetical protein